MRLRVRLGNLSRLVLRLEVCLLQFKGLCSGSDIIFPSTLLWLGLRNKSDARPSVQQSEHTPLVPKNHLLIYFLMSTIGKVS